VCFAVPGVFLRAALAALATLSLVLGGASNAAAQQPDPAPTPPPVTPDPAPEAAPKARAPVQPVAPTSGEQTAPIPTVTPAPATSNPAPMMPAGAGSPARERAAKARARRRAERRRRHERIEAAMRRRAAAARRNAAAAKEAAAHSGSFVRVGSLHPSTKSADDAHSEIFLVAAGGLLALVLASGSLLSVATRKMKGQLR
jgi:type IV secretory pathway VirB10-like protein